MRSYLRVMKAASDCNRVKILKMLQQRDLRVCEIKTFLGISQPSVSRHLHLLEEADLVRGEKDGVWSNFRLATAEECNTYSKVLLAHLRGWLEDDPDIERLQGQLQTVDHTSCAPA